MDIIQAILTLGGVVGAITGFVAFYVKIRDVVRKPFIETRERIHGLEKSVSAMHETVATIHGNQARAEECRRLNLSANLAALTALRDGKANGEVSEAIERIKTYTINNS
jgi:hypothetical protein